ncbi:uncharacterized protein LOC135685918 [Rhopilema esculentum]|uniref:uncharacterized protein LOC135685918 n=1 Tax=Rhopilema esculentum TaxID=499914 RepID=UPI0031D0D1A6
MYHGIEDGEIASVRREFDPVWEHDHIKILTFACGAVQIENGEVNARGKVESANANLKYLFAAKDTTRLAMFLRESDNQMISVDNDGNLTCRKKDPNKVYHNIHDAEDDVTFLCEIVDMNENEIRLFSKKGQGYIGFGSNGDPMKLVKDKSLLKDSNISKNTKFHIQS